MPVALAAVLERVARVAAEQGVDVQRAVSQVLVEACMRRSRGAAEEVRRCERRCVEAHERVLLREASVEACEPGDLESRYQREERLADALDRAVVAGTALRRAKLELGAWLRYARRVVQCWGLPLDGEPEPARAPRAPEDGPWTYDPPPLPPALAELLKPDARRMAETPKPLKLGPFAVVRRTDGVWVVTDERMPVGARTVYTAGPWLREANENCRDLARHEGIRETAPPAGGES